MSYRVQTHSTHGLFRALAITWISIIALTLCVLARADPSAQTRRSTTSGVFTEDQVTLGRSVFLAESCVRCHGETLVGNEFGPTLVGNEFLDKWAGMTVADLFTLIKDTMPQDNPGRLNAAQTAALVAYILKENGLPSGEAAMDSDVAALKAISIEKMGEAKKP